MLQKLPKYFSGRTFCSEKVVLRCPKALDYALVCRRLEAFVPVYQDVDCQLPTLSFTEKHTQFGMLHP